MTTLLFQSPSIEINATISEGKLSLKLVTDTVDTYLIPKYILKQKLSSISNYNILDDLDSYTRYKVQ